MPAGRPAGLRYRELYSPYRTAVKAYWGISVSNESPHANRAELGKRIKDLREKRDMNAQRVAKLAEMSPGYLSEVERGLSAISFEKLVRLAEVLGVSVGYFEGDQPEAAQPGSEVRIPAALSKAAEKLELSYRATLSLLEGKESLVARRSKSREKEWTVDEWVEFYESVKDYLPDDC